MVRRSGMLMLVLVLALTVGAMAQDNEKKGSTDAARPDNAWSFYKLDLTVREMDGAKVLNSRTYNISQRVEDWGQLRVGSRVPVVTLAGEGARPTQWQYIDIGLNMDSRLREKDGTVMMDWRLELSSVAAENTPGTNQPVIRNVKNNGQTVLAVGKSTLMSSVDDLSSTHKFVFEVTATKVK